MTSPQNSVAPKRCLKRWMEQLPEGLHHIPLLSLAIPGSHNSGTYSLDPHSEIAPDDQRPTWCMGCFVKRIVFNWSKTQSYNCREQMEGGIRYFDFRLATRKDTSDLFIVHGLYGAPVKDLLQDVKSYLDTFSQEVVLLDFQHFYKMSHEDHHSLILMLTTLFESMLCPLVADPEVMTLNWLWNRKVQVVVIYRDPIAKFHPFLWPGRLIPNPWPNLVSQNGLLEFLTENYKKGRQPGEFYVTQTILTPTLVYILRHMCSNLKNKVAQPLQAPILEWLDDKAAAGVNVVMCDFADLNEFHFPQMVIEMNYKSMKDQFKKEQEAFDQTDITLEILQE